MKKLLHPSCIVMYLLALPVFFLFGLLLAGYLGAGKGQGLAAGAIVLGYGVLAAGIAIIVAFFPASDLSIIF